jgi:membrane-associated phospholipid phosphatase
VVDPAEAARPLVRELTLPDGQWVLTRNVGDGAVVGFARTTGDASGQASAERPVLRSAIAFAALAAVTARAGNGRLWDRDQAVLRAVETLRRRPAAVRAAHAVSASAEPAFVSALLAAFAAMAGRRAGWRASRLLCLPMASGTVERRRLSQVIARPRPPAAVWLTEPEGFSLPSEHTTLAALTAGACAGSAGVRGAPRLLIPLLAAAEVGTSRVFPGVHWPSDVLAAWLFAEGWLGLAEWVVPAPDRCEEGQPVVAVNLQSARRRCL